MQGLIQLHNLKPHPKNPTLANFFKQLGWVEELGSGVRKMFKYCPLYIKDANPVIDEGDVFRIKISYENTTQETTQETLVVDFSLAENSDNQIVVGLNNFTDTTQESMHGTTQETINRILKLIQDNPKINRTQIAAKLGTISEGGVKYYLAKLTNDKVIKHIGSTKSGYWIIIKN